MIHQFTISDWKDLKLKRWIKDNLIFIRPVHSQNQDERQRQSSSIISSVLGSAQSKRHPYASAKSSFQNEEIIIGNPSRETNAFKLPCSQA